MIAHKRQRGCAYFLRLGLVAVFALIVFYNTLFPAFITYNLLHVRHRVDTSPETILGYSYFDVTLQTVDNLNLAAWYIASTNRAAVILIHGSNGNRLNTLAHAAMLADHGYGVLMLDLRGHGNSAGDEFHWGWDSNPDIDAAVAYLQRLEEVDPQSIGVYGLSMGGEVALQSAAANPGIQAVIADGAGIRTFVDFMSIPGGGKVLNIPFIWVQTKTLEVLTQIAPPPALVDLIPQIAPRAVFFIVNERAAVPERLLGDVYYAVAGEPKTLWVVPNAGHVEGIQIARDEYEQRVIAFFDAALRR